MNAVSADGSFDAAAWQAARRDWLSCFESTLMAAAAAAATQARAKSTDHARHVVLVDDNAWLRSMRKAIAHIAQRGAFRPCDGDGL